MSIKNFRNNNLNSNYTTSNNIQTTKMSNLSNKFPNFKIKENFLTECETVFFSRASPIKHGYDFKGRFYKTLKTGKVIQIKKIIPISKNEPNNEIPVKSIKSNNRLKVKLHNQEITLKENLFKIQSETFNKSGLYIRKFKLFTDNLLKSREEKNKSKNITNKSTTTQEFRTKIELYLENMKKIKTKLENSITYTHKNAPKNTYVNNPKKFIEVKENSNFSKTVDHIYRTINIKNEKNHDIKSERISNLLNKEITTPIWNNALLRIHQRNIIKPIKIRENENSQEYENILTGENVLFTQKLNRPFLFTETSNNEKEDNLFISKMACNFTSKEKNYSIES